MIVTAKENNLVEISTDMAHTLARVGEPLMPNAIFRRTTIRETDLDKWREVLIEDLPLYTEAEYSERVDQLIREQYSLSEELAIRRKKLNQLLNPISAQDEAVNNDYTLFNEFVEECKVRAKEQLSIEKISAETADASKIN